MNHSIPTGLGEPVLSGKRSLFQPPKLKPKNNPPNTHIRQARHIEKPPVKRIRTTTELTPQALTLIQEIQQRHRLKTGKVMPVWKIISQAIEQHGRENGKVKPG